MATVNMINIQRNFTWEASPYQIIHVIACLYQIAINKKDEPMIERLQAYQIKCCQFVDNKSKKMYDYNTWKRWLADNDLLHPSENMEWKLWQKILEKVDVFNRTLNLDFSASEIASKVAACRIWTSSALKYRQSYSHYDSGIARCRATEHRFESRQRSRSTFPTSKSSLSFRSRSRSRSRSDRSSTLQNTSSSQVKF